MNIREAVATKINNSGDDIKNAVVEHLASQVIDKRVSQAVQAFAELDKVEKELRKLNPDVIHYDKDGSPHAPAYSKAVFENCKKVLERQGKFEKALEKALGDAQDYNDLSSLVGKQEAKQGEKQGEKSEGE